jgi:hypothetical protein
MLDQDLHGHAVSTAASLRWRYFASEMRAPSWIRASTLRAQLGAAGRRRAVLGSIQARVWGSGHIFFARLLVCKPVTYQLRNIIMLLSSFLANSVSPAAELGMYSRLALRQKFCD